MASNSNTDPPTPISGIDAPPEPSATPEVATPAEIRFRTCRWQQPAEDDQLAFCTHREVKPYAGTASFDPVAWCPDCELFKLRRTPKKRPYDASY